MGDVVEWIVTYGSESHTIQLWKPQGEDEDEKDADHGLVAPNAFSKKLTLGPHATHFKVEIVDADKKEIKLVDKHHRTHYLHEPHDHEGVTLWHTGKGNHWV